MSLALAGALDELNRSGAVVSVSVAVDGMGAALDQRSSELLAPASNQKLLVAAAVLETMPLDDRLHTTVVATGPTVDGVVRGDLVLVGGGDPDLARTAAQSLHSLDALATQVKARGITRIEGRLLVDDTRFDSLRSAPGWPSSAWQSVGPLSALMVDRNRSGSDGGYLADPALGNAHFFKTALEGAGIAVAGTVEHGVVVPGELVASLSSVTVRELVIDMLSTSDNLTAELLVKELGHRRRSDGSTAAGLAVAREIIAGLCVAFDGTDADGSGLSHDDRRSARSLRELLTTAKTRPWWPAFRDAFAVAGRSGTLSSRLLDPATAGNVRAKTGSIQPARALSGYLTTAGGAPAVFSIIVSTPNANAEKAIDAFVTALAQLP